jgi:hypothetical protein
VGFGKMLDTTLKHLGTKAAQLLERINALSPEERATLVAALKDQPGQPPPFP